MGKTKGERREGRVGGGRGGRGGTGKHDEGEFPGGEKKEESR